VKSEARDFPQTLTAEMLCGDLSGVHCTRLHPASTWPQPHKYFLQLSPIFAFISLFINRGAFAVQSGPTFLLRCGATTLLRSGVGEGPKEPDPDTPPLVRVLFGARRAPFGNH